MLLDGDAADVLHQILDAFLEALGATFFERATDRGIGAGLLCLLPAFLRLVGEEIYHLVYSFGFGAKEQLFVSFVRISESDLVVAVDGGPDQTKGGALRPLQRLAQVDGDLSQRLIVGHGLLLVAVETADDSSETGVATDFQEPQECGPQVIGRAETEIDREAQEGQDEHGQERLAELAEGHDCLQNR